MFCILIHFCVFVMSSYLYARLYLWHFMIVCVFWCILMQMLCIFTYVLMQFHVILCNSCIVMYVNVSFHQNNWLFKNISDLSPKATPRIMNVWSRSWTPPQAWSRTPNIYIYILYIYIHISISISIYIWIWIYIYIYINICIYNIWADYNDVVGRNQIRNKNMMLHDSIRILSSGRADDAVLHIISRIIHLK